MGVMALFALLIELFILLNSYIKKKHILFYALQSREHEFFHAEAKISTNFIDFLLPSYQKSQTITTSYFIFRQIGSCQLYQSFSPKT